MEITLKNMDLDKDGKVSFLDYKDTVEREPLLMETFGPCLPTTKAGFTFLKNFMDKMPQSRIYQE